MSISFGIYACPSSVAWDDIRKGPPLAAVREHLDRVVNFDRYRTIAGGKGQQAWRNPRRQGQPCRRNSRLGGKASNGLRMTPVSTKGFSERSCCLRFRT